MKYIIILIVLVLGTTVNPSVISAPTEESVEMILTQQASVVSSEVYRIIHCESRWKDDAVGDDGRAYGLAQFHKPTWNWLCKLSGKDLDYRNPHHQIELLTWALEHDYGYLWTCF